MSSNLSTTTGLHSHLMLIRHANDMPVQNFPLRAWHYISDKDQRTEQGSISSCWSWEIYH